MITEAQVREMKPKDIVKLKSNELSAEAFDYVHEAHEINSCDRCKQLESSYDLKWLDEEYDEELFFSEGEYVALCKACVEEIREEN
jgi:hypothetical protein